MQRVPQMTPEELERHQRSVNGTCSPGGPYYIGRGSFPIPNAQQSLAFNGELVDYSATPGQPVQSRVPTQTQGHVPSPLQPPQPASRPEADPVSSLLAEMPTESDDPARHALWSELVRLKTRSLELQIAEARRKEKEAELELARLQHGGGSGNQSDAPGPSGNGPNGPETTMSGSNIYNLPRHDLSQQQPAYNNFNQTYDTAAPGQNHNAMSPFDLDALLQADNHNFLSWLPDLGTGDVSQPPQSTSSNSMPFSLDPSTGSNDATGRNVNPAPPSQPSPTHRTSPSSSHSPPPPKRAKRAIEKKLVVERSCSCMICQKPLARVLIRAPKSQLPDPITMALRCSNCIPVDQPSTLPDQATSSSGSPIGTVETRKRMRVSMEIDDEEAKVKERRTWCDVCQRVLGSGQIMGGKNRDSILQMAEIICISCDSKYQRCTDCGGGGGPRVGIGKWRMKQVFHPGRKTCSLSHTRLGDRTRELGVHVTPCDFTPEQLKEVLSRCKALWQEKTFSRLAIPEMLEVDLPPTLANPLRDFTDVDDIVTRNWPSREAMIRADGVDQNRFKRLLSLIWAHSKPRRSVRTVDLEEEWSKQADENDEEDMSTVLANVKKTNVVIPAGSELIGMWGGEWDMQNGSLLISTFIPFEGTDGEDSTALSVGEMITKVQDLCREINVERTVQARRQGKEPNLLPLCEHLWTVSGGYIPLVRERFADILIRKRAFVHVEEYLTRHPSFINCIQARPVGLHPDIHRPVPQQDSSDESEPRPLILVRWLGKEFDAQKILEIKQMEFGGGKGKVKKRPRSKT